MRPFVLKLVLVLSMTVIVVDSQAEPVSSAEQMNDHVSRTELVEVDPHQAASIDFLLPSR